MKPGGDDSDYKLVSTSSNRSRLCHFMGNNSAYDILCVHKVKRKIETIFLVI